METIKIAVQGEELEVINVELTAEEVRGLYVLRKEQIVKIAELEKKLDSTEKSKKYADDRDTESRNELSQANTLLTALGIAEKTNEENDYQRKALTVSTRIALYIASVKTI
jgi:hypothetical protein